MSSKIQFSKKVSSRTRGVIRCTRLLEPFLPKMEIPRSISAPLEIRRGTKNRHFERRSVLLAPKMPSKRRPGAKVEKWMKNGSKNDRFFDGKTFQNYALCNEFKLFAISEKVEKSMPKWPPKVMKNHSKWHPGAAKVDLFIIFMHFGQCRKNMIFRCRSGSSKNR